MEADIDRIPAWQASSEYVCSFCPFPARRRHVLSIPELLKQGLHSCKRKRRRWTKKSRPCYLPLNPGWFLPASSWTPCRHERSRHISRIKVNNVNRLCWGLGLFCAVFHTKPHTLATDQHSSSTRVCACELRTSHPRCCKFNCNMLSATGCEKSDSHQKQRQTDVNARLCVPAPTARKRVNPIPENNSMISSAAYSESGPDRMLDFPAEPHTLHRKSIAPTMELRATKPAASAMKIIN